MGIELPGWVNGAVIIVCIALALLALVLMFRAVRSTGPDSDDELQRSSFDPVLFLSTLAVIALAVVAFVFVTR